MIAPERLGFQALIPAESFRGALVYPSCATDRSSGSHRGRLYCSWMDLTSHDVNTDILLSSSDDQGAHWSTPKPVTDQFAFPVDRFNHWLSVDPVTRTPNTRVTSVSSNEHDCNGLFPCPGIDYGNQQGDYEGLVSYGGVSHPIWTDSRDQLNPSTGCKTDLAMEEVFSATVK